MKYLIIAIFITICQLSFGQKALHLKETEVLGIDYVIKLMQNQDTISGEDFLELFDIIPDTLQLSRYDMTIVDVGNVLNNKYFYIEVEILVNNRCKYYCDLYVDEKLVLISHSITPKMDNYLNDFKIYSPTIYQELEGKCFRSFE